MQTPYTKRQRSPEQDMESNKKTKVWDPKNQAQAPVRKSAFPARSLDSKVTSNKVDIDAQLDEDQRKVDEAIKTAKTPEQLKKAKSAAEYLKKVSKGYRKLTNNQLATILTLKTTLSLLQVKATRMSDANNNIEAAKAAAAADAEDTLKQARTSGFKRPGSSSGTCLLYTSPSPRDRQKSRMPSSA